MVAVAVVREAAAAAARGAGAVAGRIATPCGGAFAAAAQVFQQLRRHLFQKARGQRRIRHVVAVAAAIARAAQDQRVHRARHPHVAEAPFLFKTSGIGERARVRKQPLLHAAQQDQRKLQPLRRMQRHQGDAAVRLIVIRVADQRCVVQKFSQCLAAFLGILCGVGELLQVFNARKGLRRAFVFERADVAAAVVDEANQLRQSGFITGLAERCPFFFRRFRKRRFFRRCKRRSGLLQCDIIEGIEGDVRWSLLIGSGLGEGLR